MSFTQKIMWSYCVLPYTEVDWGLLRRLKAPFHSIGSTIGLEPDARDGRTTPRYGVKKPRLLGLGRTIRESACLPETKWVRSASDINQSNCFPWIPSPRSLISGLVLGSLERKIYLSLLQYSHKWQHRVTLGIEVAQSYIGNRGSTELHWE